MFLAGYYLSIHRKVSNTSNTMKYTNNNFHIAKLILKKKLKIS